MHVPTAIGDGRPRTATQDDLRSGPPRLPHSAVCRAGSGATEYSPECPPSRRKKHVGRNLSYLSSRGLNSRTSFSLSATGSSAPIPRRRGRASPRPPPPPQAPPVDAGCPPLPYPYAEPNARCYSNGRRCGKPMDRSARLNNGARPEKANARHDLKRRADASRAEHETPPDRKKNIPEKKDRARRNRKRASTLFATEDTRLLRSQYRYMCELL